MRTKSKFITFLLSFIPGLSHFYLGYPDRGAIYLFLFGGVTVGSVGMGVLTHSDFFLFTLLGGAGVIWLVALIDAFSIIGNMRNHNGNIQAEGDVQQEDMNTMNKKVITLGLSMVPGAGHMYLGYQKRGLVFMGGFFLSIFLMGWLNLSFLLFILPLIWFYSFFDAFHILNGDNIEDVDIGDLLPSIKQEHIGMGLIALGIINVLQKIFYPMISIYIGHEFRNYIQTSIVSLIFIIGGIKMIKKKRDMESIEEDEEDE